MHLNDQSNEKWTWNLELGISEFLVKFKADEMGGAYTAHG
jgi:hypothetical protein